MSGWIKLHRKINDSEIFSDPELLRLWMLLLSKASYKEKTIEINRKVVEVKPGEFVCGRKSLYEEYNQNIKPKNVVKETTLWNWLKKLEGMEMVTLQSEKLYTVVTINNWSEYQTEDSPEDETSNLPEEERTPALEDYKNLEEEIEGGEINMSEIEPKKPKKKKSVKDYVYDKTDIEYQLAGQLFLKMRENNPKVKTPNPQKWADKMRLILERDKRDPGEVLRVINWSQDDDFWMMNILSPEKLRKQYDRLYMQMEKESSKGNRKSGTSKLQTKNDLLRKMMEEEENDGQEGNSQTIFLNQ